MEGAYTGPEFSDDEIRIELEKSDLEYERYSDEMVTQMARVTSRMELSWDGFRVAWNLDRER
jgi:predicted NodU family carbamoyl transferase